MSDGEVLEKYKTIKTLGFVNGLYRSCYDNLCLAEKVKIPIGEYMGEEGVVRYRELLKEIMYRLEELSDMLDVVDDRMVERLDVWGKERE